MPTLDELLKMLLVPVPGMRRGQAFFNELWRVDPILAQKMYDAGLDPYYDEDKLWPAVEFVVAEFDQG